MKKQSLNAVNGLKYILILSLFLLAGAGNAQSNNIFRSDYRHGISDSILINSAARSHHLHHTTFMHKQPCQYNLDTMQKHTGDVVVLHKRTCEKIVHDKQISMVYLLAPYATPKSEKTYRDCMTTLYLVKRTQ